MIDFLLLKPWSFCAGPWAEFGLCGLRAWLPFLGTFMLTFSLACIKGGSILNTRFRFTPLFKRALVLIAALAVLGLLLRGQDATPVTAHNLQTKMVYMFADPATQTLMDDRINNGWVPGTPLLQVNDEVGLIIKVVPRDGTTTGVGGHVDFYVPNGVTVTDADYVVPDGSGGYTPIPMKGQSPIAVGAGPIGAKVKPQLVGLSLGPNINGVTEPVVTGTGLMRGTIAGVYGDTGIFYSTLPDTSYDTWVKSGGFDQNTGTGTDNTMTNNSGDVVTPLNKWDAEQLLAWGAKAPIVAIVDTPDQRGNAPWGLASGVAGPQSGYAWDFDWDYWRTSGMSAADMRAASDQQGPWQRIKYAGSRISKDTAGSASTTIGFANIDGGSVGVDLVAGDLPPTHPTTGQTDATSPKALRWAVGQLTQYRPEYVRVKLKINNTTAILDPSGCPVFNGGTFGGDAGGSDNGKDHLWRYYEPSRTVWNGCAGIGKPSDRIAVKVGENFQYKVKFYNLGTLTLTNVIVKDTLPAGVLFISSVPAQSSGPNPLQWNVGTLQPGQKFEALVTVKATGSGLLENCVLVDTNQLPDQQACELTYSGALPFLKQGKTANPTTVTPGGNVQYTIQIDNIGTGATGTPVTVAEYLPTGFIFVSKDMVTLNGANVTATTTVNTSSPYSFNQPLFTVPGAINAGQSLIIKFTAQAPVAAPAGSYCNTYTTTENGIPQTTGSLACVDLGGGAIGDTIYRDWDGDGVQDADEEGLPGVVVELQNGVCTPGVNCPVTTTNTDGFYQFTGLTAGTYTVKVLSGVPTGYTQTGDPDEAGTCTICNGQSTVTLATNEKKLDRDFGYRPGGTGSVGDKVFDDKNADGSFNGSDVGIPSVTVRLYEDTNGNGTIDVGTDALVATTTTNGSGTYTFSGLATGLKYIADVDQTDADISSYYVTNYGSATGVVQTTTDPHNVGTLAGAYTAADFGFYKTVPGAIGDDVFVDTDGDGTRDPGEAGLPNVTVKLYLDSDGDGVLDPGEPLLDTTSTDANGNYSFTGLPAGSYIVDVDENDADLPSNVLPSKDPIATSLTQGQQRTDIDFPFIKALTKSVDKSYVDPSGTLAARTLTYQISPRVPGTTLLAGVVVNDTIPAGTTYIAASVNAGGTADDTDDPADGIIDTVSWDLGSNAVGTTGFKGGTPPAACQTTTTVVADRDTWLEQVDPDQNHGTDNSIDTANDTNDKVGLLHFSIGTGTLPAGATLNSATLKLTPSGGAGANRQIEIHELATAWAEGTAADAACTSAGNGAAWQGPNCTDDWLSTAGNFGTSDYSGTNLGTLNPTTNDTTVTASGASLDSVVSGWLTGGTNNGLGMIPVGSATNTVSWYTRTEGTTTRRPQIELTYTPNGCSGTTVIRESGSGEVPDTFVQEDNATSFHGGEAEIKVKPDSGARRIGLVQFDLSGVPAGATISSASMALYVTRSRASQTHSVHVMTTDWTEGTSATNGATWNDSNGTGTVGDWSSGTFGTGDYNASVQGTITPSTNGTKTVALTSAVQGWIASPSTNKGVAVIPSGNNGEAKYASSENGTVVRRPTLTVNWSIPPTGANGTNTMSASGMVVQNGDTVTVKQVLTDSDGVALTGVAPSTLTITGASGANATCGSASPASQTVPANGSATFTWTCTITAVGTTPGSVTFAASATNGSTTWSSAGSNSVIVSPVLQFQVSVNTTPGVDIVTNEATLEDANLPEITSNPVDTAVTSSIGDFVWNDYDHDGVQDAGEGGIPGVRVYIDSDNDGVYDVGEPTDITDANGNYRIGGLANGSYNVRLDITTLPANYYPTTPTLLSKTVTVAGQQITDADFGATERTGSIGDTIWLDADEDGTVDVVETGIAGVTVRLYRDVNNSNTIDAGDYVVAVDVTDAGGNYLFDGLYAGSFIVDVDQTTLPGGVELVSPAGRTDPEDIDLAEGEDNLTIDFGYNYGGSIGDRLWYDDDGDGIGPAGTPGGTDVGEPYVTAGAVVTLYTDSNGNGEIDPGEPIYAVTTTNGSGAYLFDNLPPGNYVVKVDEQTVESRSTPGTYSTMVPTNGETKAVMLAGNQDYTAADFGFIERAVVEGHVFYDEDHNGVLDAGETLLPNVTVTLNGVDVGGNPVSMSTITDADGEYDFIVLPGTYTIAYNTADPDIPANLTEATTPLTYPSLSVVAGVEYSGFDFGRDDPGKIGDRVWKDDDGDGIQDAGESGIGGVTVRLYADNNNDGLVDGGDTLLEVQATAAVTGEYLFEGLPVGAGAHYVVQVDSSTIPAGFTQTGDPDQPGVVCTICNHQGNADLPTSTPLLTIDFGYSPPTLLVSGNIWKDNDGDGVDDGAGEPGIPGVTVLVSIDTNGDNITDIVLSDVTDANGDYSVSGIPTGSNVTITVDETTLPSTAYTQTGDEDEVGTCLVCDAKTTITNVTVNQTGKDFGYQEVLGSISGTVVQNADGDGLAEGGETPVAGVVVTLTYAGPDNIVGTGDDVTSMDTTDAFGDYSFTGLVPGVYEISKTNPPGYSSLADRDGANPDVIGLGLTLGEDSMDQDFELQSIIVATATIGDRIWLDENANGVQDAGEDGIPNIRVELRDGVCTPGVNCPTTVTDNDGNYIFTDVAPGSYTVAVVSATLPTGLVQTFDPDGTPNHQTPVTVVAGQELVTADFGYDWAPAADVTGNTGTGAIGDRLWIDADGDGLQDPGEPGLGGITVRLYSDPDNDGVYSNLVATVVTDAAGNYIFDGLAAGVYVVQVNGGTTPAGYTQTGDPDATLDNKSNPIPLAPGDVYLNADFGYDPAAGSTIGDLVFIDLNGDGTFDPGEPGVPGVTVALVRDTNMDGDIDPGEPVIATDITDAGGNYTFPGLPAGDYIVWVNDTANVLGELVPTVDPDGGFDDIASVNVDGTTDDLTQDFGYAPAGHDSADGLIGDTVFLDRNGDNAFSLGEGLEGVTVRLYTDTNNDGNFDAGEPLVATTVTDENGNYTFGDLAAGNYVVQVDTSTLPAGLTNTVDPGGAPASESGVTLGAGAINLNQDFGYRDLTNPNIIAGTLWVDTDADGLLEGSETGRFAGVTVVLRDASGDIIGSTTTNASGNFSFSNLPDGTFAVDVTDDANVLEGYWHSLGTATLDNNSQSDPYTVSVSAGATNTTADFGYYRDPASLGNFVWNDVDGDGIQDGGELGIPGVLVTLTITYPNATVVTVTTVTDANGAYSFPNLLLDENFDGVGAPEPTYSISVATPPGTVPSPQNQTTENLDSDNPAGEPAFPVEGTANNTYDFGFTPQVPQIGIAKRASTVTNNGDGTYTVVYDMIVRNYGDVALSMVQVTDNLATTFTGATSFSVLSKTSPDFAVNAAYTGSAPNTSLLMGTDTLAVGTQGTIQLTVKVTPGANVGPYNNTAVATGKSPTNQTVTDNSQDGVNPDPDNDGDPTDNNVPTPVTFTENPYIGLAKAVSTVTNNGDGTYTVVYNLIVRNYGNVKLSMVQVTDNLAATFAGATSFSVLAKSSADFAVNAGYTGSAPNTNLLAGTDMLDVGAQGTISLTVKVTPGANLGPFNNSATASGKSPAGTTVTDTSQDGVNPDPDADNDPTDNNVPTPVSFTESPRIGIAKDVASVTNNGDGTYTVVYDLVVRNYGDVKLSMVQVVDDLSVTFFGATGFGMVSVSSTDFAVSAGYTGSAPNTNLLMGTDMLNVGAQGTLHISVKVSPGGNLGPYDNTATATGKSPAGTTVMDNSQDGVNPDPDADNDPTDNNDPTPLTFTEDPSIGIAKAVSSVVNNGDGTYTVSYNLDVRNYGNVKLSNVQVTDNLATTFAGATSFTVLGKSSSDFTVNGGYTGSAPNTSLLAGSDMLNVGASGTIQLVVKVTPGGNLGPYNNSATATGKSPSNQTVTDTSQDGVDPDPDDDIDPTNNNDPTPVSFTENPRIGIAKRVDTLTNNGDGTYTVGYTLVVRNYGNVKLSMVQVTDNFATTFAGATGFSVIGLTSADFATNGAFTGSAPNTSLLMGTDMLNVGAQGTIQVTVKVTPGGNLGPFNNTATATGESPAGTTVMDNSQDGVNPDPDNDNDPTDNNVPTPASFTEEPRLGLAKDATSVTNNGDGTYTVVYSILVRNYGNVKLSSVQVVDNLAATFAGATTFTVLSKTSATFTINPAYNGAGNTNLLLGTDMLNVGAQGTINVTVKVTPGANLGPYNNLAVGAGTSPAGTTVGDTSQDGVNPDPDDDNDPTDNNVPTPVSFAETPRIGIAKAVSSVVNNGDGTYTVVYNLDVRNYGNVKLSSVQVTDNLAATFAGATSFTVLGKTSSDFAINAAYTGSAPNTALLMGTDMLLVGGSGTIQVSVKVTPGANLGPFNNTAVASGTSPAGANVTDNSQDGVNPDPDNNGNPTDNNVPTPVSFTEEPSIGIAKDVTSVTNNGDGTYTVVYSLVVRNYGNVKLSMVQVVDDLAATFAGATSFTVLSKTSATFAVNAGYTGSAPNTNLLAGSDMLNVGASGTITLTVKVTPGSNLGPFNNTATATGKSPAGTTVMDDSQDGVSPDPDNDGDPTDNNDPTPLSFTEDPSIGIAKAVSSVVNNGDGTYTVHYNLDVRNYGNVKLSSVQVTDNLAATFAGATSFTVLGKTSSDFAINAGYTGGAPNTNLLAGTDMLNVGAGGTIQMVVKVTPGANLGPFNNSATATGKSPANQTVTDTSQDGVNPDPDNDGDPTDNNAPTPVSFTENPRIGIAKDVTSVTNNGDGTYTVVYSLVVRNYGNVKLSMVQVSDNLGVTFAGATSYGSVNVTSGDFAVNAGYTGSAPNTNLLLGTDMLIVGAQGTIQVSVRVTPGVNLGPFNNTATATGESPAGTTVMDNSQDGVNPDPDDDNDPTDNNDPTPLTFDESPRIGIAKAVSSVVNNGDGTYTVHYNLLVRNYGDVKLSMVQVADNLATTFAGATSFTVLGTASGDFTVNAGYTGSAPNTNLLAGSDMLNVGAGGTIQVSVKVTPGANTGPFNNTAVATGKSPAGTTVTDSSQDGINPDPDNDDDPTDNNVPTPVSFTEEPSIGIAKDVVSVTNNGDGTYTVVYNLLVANYGDVKLSMVQVADNLGVTFAGATSYGSVSVTSTDFAVNAGYTGSAPNTNLLLGTDMLNVGASGMIRVSVKVTPGVNLGPFNNTATATGKSPAGTTVMDNSQDGVQPDPDNDGDPSDNNDPTPVSFDESPRIGIAKAVSAVTNNGDGTYTVNYSLLVRNYGNVKLSMVQVTDNLAATFAGATSFTVLGTASSDFTVNGGYTGSAPNTNLLTGSDMLTVGGQGTIQLSVKVTPGGNTGPFNNTAVATGKSPAGTTVTDSSQDGVNPDPDNDNDPTDNNAPTPVSFTEDPSIGISKIASSVTSNGSGAYTVVYDLLVRNYGNVKLSMVQVSDNLGVTFAGATSYGAVSVTSSDFAVNAGYTGSAPNTNLLLGTDTLDVGDQGSIRVSVTVTPGINLGPYNNTATATGKSPAGTTVMDNSQDGVNPDPDSDGDPSDNNDPTPVGFTDNPRIGLAKMVTAVTPLTGGAFNVTYTLVVRNYGSVMLSNVQVTDNLALTFAGATAFDQVSVTSGDFTVNPGYSGTPPNTNLLAGSDTLAVGAQGTVQISVRVFPGTNPGPYNNTATATGRSPAGTNVSDTSQDGVNPDPDGDNNPGNNGAPTPLVLQRPPAPPTGVTLTALAVQPRPGGGTEVVWTTSAETDVAGFNVLRADVADGAFVRINPALIPATGGASAGENYRFADTDGTVDHVYKLEVVSTDGAPRTYGPVAVGAPWQPRGERLYLPAVLRNVAMGMAEAPGGANGQGGPVRKALIGMVSHPGRGMF